jgi:hypothetical protein
LTLSSAAAPVGLKTAPLKGCADLRMLVLCMLLQELPETINGRAAMIGEHPSAAIQKQQQHNAHAARAY